MISSLHHIHIDIDIHIPSHNLLCVYVGVLTYDGRILNKSGHMMVALTLLRELGLSFSPLHQDERRNIILNVCIRTVVCSVLFVCMDICMYVPTYICMDLSIYIRYIKTLFNCVWRRIFSI